MTDPARDLEICRQILRRGSRSFSWASTILPPTVHRAVVPVYAFCRIADDLVDDDVSGADAVGGLEVRLEAIYRGRPHCHPVDRALARVVTAHRIPRALFDALLDGFRWDVERRPIDTMSDVLAYSARVAGAVGAIVTMLMGRRDGETLARACELGLAMQLTNIARDVGEDAARGRCYLPARWFVHLGIDRDAWQAAPRITPEIRVMVQRLLDAADQLYHRSEAGIGRLPRFCQPSIWLARYVYADIGTSIRRNGLDSVSFRAYTTRRRKVRLAGRALARWIRPSAPRPVDRRAPVRESQFLVAAAAINSRRAVGGISVSRRSVSEPLEVVND